MTTGEPGWCAGGKSGAQRVRPQAHRQRQVHAGQRDRLLTDIPIQPIGGGEVACGGGARASRAPEQGVRAAGSGWLLTRRSGCCGVCSYSTPMRVSAAGAPKPLLVRCDPDICIVKRLESAFGSPYDARSTLSRGQWTTICSEALSDTPGMSSALSRAMVAPMDPVGTMLFVRGLKLKTAVPMVMTGRMIPANASEPCGRRRRRLTRFQRVCFSLRMRCVAWQTVPTVGMCDCGGHEERTAPKRTMMSIPVDEVRRPERRFSSTMPRRLEWLKLLSMIAPMLLGVKGATWGENRRSSGTGWAC